MLQYLTAMNSAVGVGSSPYPVPHTSDRKLRLFAVACCRQVWHLLTDERSRKAVEVAERFADGKATEGELNRSRNDAYYLDPAQENSPERCAAYMVANLGTDPT